MGDEPKKIDFSKLRLPERVEPNDFAKFKPGTCQFRGTLTGWLRKGGGWPKIVRGWRFLRLRDE